MTPPFFAMSECLVYLVLCNLMIYAYCLYSGSKISRRQLFSENLIFFVLFWLVLLSTEVFMSREIGPHFTALSPHLGGFSSPAFLGFSVYVIIVWGMGLNLLSLLKRKAYGRYGGNIVRHFYLLNFIVIFVPFTLTFFLGYILGVWNPHTFLI